MGGGGKSRSRGGRAEEETSWNETRRGQVKRERVAMDIMLQLSTIRAIRKTLTPHIIFALGASTRDAVVSGLRTLLSARPANEGAFDARSRQIASLSKHGCTLNVQRERKVGRVQFLLYFTVSRGSAFALARSSNVAEEVRQRQGGVGFVRL